MKILLVAASIFVTLALGGCQATHNLQSEDALVARQLMTKYCVVGRLRQGNPTKSTFVREGIVNKDTAGPSLQYKHKMFADDITIFSIKDFRDGWVVVDAKSQRARDNFYFNRSTGQFTCSQKEWWAKGGKALKEVRFKTAPNIIPRTKRIP
ncbi:MAG: hypothetical protein JKY17_05655 [Magnetovibrio sp.]|nr:hypothetical protein [Magnetovibrio sp.]